MTEARYKEVVEYYNVCATCGEEFTVPKGRFSQKICDSCQTKAAVARAKKELERFIGATIISIEPVQVHYSSAVSASELAYIEVKTADGKCVRFAPCGDGGRYIEWEERSIP